MQFEMNRDSSTIRRIEKRIVEVELANRYVKKSTRLHQNKKSIILLNEKLNRAVYQHNKFNMYNMIEKELDKVLYGALEKQFENFASL